MKGVYQLLIKENRKRMRYAGKDERKKLRSQIREYKKIIRDKTPRR